MVYIELDQVIYIYIINRFYILCKFTENDNETEIDVTMEDVSNEMNDFFKKKFRDFQHFTKPVNRKYGFELPGIPPETQYLKVTYPFTRMLF